MCAALGLPAVFAGCGSPSTPAAPAKPAAPPITADTWAAVDGRQIMRSEVDKAFDVFLKGGAGKHPKVAERLA